MRVITPRSIEAVYHVWDGNFSETYTQISVADFPEDVFRRLLNRNPEVDDTRSQVLQFRLPNGDLILGFYPQGDSYFEIENHLHLEDAPLEALPTLYDEGR